MTPQDELRAAAAKLRKTAAAATPGPWARPLDVRNKAVVTAALPEGEQGNYVSGNNPDGTRERVGVVMVNTWSDGKHLRKRGGRDLEWIALANPLLAEPLAAWLEQAATSYEDLVATDCGAAAELIHVESLAVARVINGSAVVGAVSSETTETNR